MLVLTHLAVLLASKTFCREGKLHDQALYRLGQFLRRLDHAQVGSVNALLGPLYNQHKSAAGRDGVVALS
jgi:hypothetical protein